MDNVNTFTLQFGCMSLGFNHTRGRHIGRLLLRLFLFSRGFCCDVQVLVVALSG